jgi:hypothetical protein
MSDLKDGEFRATGRPRVARFAATSVVVEYLLLIFHLPRRFCFLRIWAIS